MSSIINAADARRVKEVNMTDVAATTT